ncbi:polysaccharide export protein [Alteromonas sp. ZYF713]|nr:polysaccharide export protein [Alteromonas sp. ZYF713]
MKLVTLGAVICFLCTFMASAQEADYVLGTGDTISIRVHGEPDLTFETKIGTNGSILYPFLGEIKVKGRTAADIRWLIVSGLKGDYLVNPEVDVNVTGYRPFFILGEVREPKDYPYQPGLTLAQAIAVAGGLTERASEENIEIKRKLDNGKIQILNNLGMDELLQPGDTVVIKQSFF